MPTIPRGLSIMATLIPALSPRLTSLTHWTVHFLTGIRHQRTGQALVHVRSPSPSLSPSVLSQTHGAIIAFEVSDALGSFVNCEAIEYGAGKSGICLRAGCMCNPGGTSYATGMGFVMDAVRSGDRKEDLEARFGVRSRGVVVSHQDFIICVGLTLTAFSQQRASFGIASNFADAWAFIEYMRSLAVENAMQRLLDDWGKAPAH